MSRSTRRSTSSACSSASGVDPQTGAQLHRRAATGADLPGAQRPRRRRDARRPTRAASPQHAPPTGTARSFLDDPAYLAAVGDLLGRGRHARGATTRRTARSGSPPCPVPQRDRPRGAGDHQLPRRRARRARRSTLRTYAIVAVLSLGLITLLAALQSGRLLAPLRAVRETARDITTSDLSRRIPETGNDDITALTRTFNDMLDRLEDGVRGAAAVPRRRRARAADAAHRAARSPRAARRRRPRRGRAHPRAAARRGGPDDPAGRRPDPAGQEPAARLRQAAPVGPRRAHRVAAGQGPRAGRPRTGCSSDAGAGSVAVDEQRITQARAASSPTTRSSTRVPATRSRSGRAYDGRSVRLWVRGHRARACPPADRERIFERFGAGGRSAGRRGLRARPVHRPRHRRGPRRHVDVTDAVPHGARFELAPADRPRRTRWPAS